MSGKIFWDVGAGAGTYTELLRQKFNKTLVFEPNPVSNANLRRRFRRDKTVKIYECGLASSTGMKVLTRSRDRYELSSFMKDYRPTDDDVESSSDLVKTISIDDLICRKHISDRISLMKIDTEGAELDILKGAELTLEQGLIDSMLVETHFWAVGPEQLEATFEKHGYRWKWLDRGAETPHVFAYR